MTITSFDIEHMSEIMSDSRASQYNWFTAKLLRLMADADLENLRLLSQVYPKEFIEFCMWKWKGVPYQFVTIESVKFIMNMERLNGNATYRWLNPETGEEVKAEVKSGRDF